MTDLEPLDLLVHRAKVAAHQALRWSEDRRAPVERARASRLLVELPLAAEDRSPLWNRDVDPREWPLELGKVENLRVAALRLDGLEFEAGQVCSFWAQVGPPLAARGFVAGRELREGCVVPGIGGGLCLLSNALFGAATRAGLTILERHPHSRRPPGSRAALGADATVAWNYIDLRFVGEIAWRLEVELEAEALVVRIRLGLARLGLARLVLASPRGSSEPSVPSIPHAAPQASPRGSSEPSVPSIPHAAPQASQASRAPSGRGSWSGDLGRSCNSCEQPCASAKPPDPAARVFGRRTWLLDAVWPEHVAYLREQVRPEDRLAIPIDGELVGVGRYAWPRVAVAERIQFPARTLLRSLRSRRLASQGPARQRALLADDRRLATAMAATLTAEDTELVVAHNLVSHLDALGALGGRRVTVLMQRLPLAELHARLDQARARWPDSPTLGDFRADPSLLAHETRALAAAAELVTPHVEVAGMVGSKLRQLDWALRRRPGPARAAKPGPLRLWFPASTVARKGAWELREALADAGPCQLWISGRELEGPRFWPSALATVHATPSLAEIDAVVLPAWVEHQPRALLRALAAGVPVIASRACGLGPLEGVRSVETGDVEQLRAAILELRRGAEPGSPESGSSCGRPV